MHNIRVAAIQMRVSNNVGSNVESAVSLVKRAANERAQIVVLPELFSYPYFCKDQDPSWLQYARPAKGNSLLDTFRALARECSVILPISFFERVGNTCFNSIAVIDNLGHLAGIYRKAHIPDGPGYQEKFYFTPGDIAFRPFPTQACQLGTLICWDQWFPEPARLLALQGAELIVYPTAIGSEPTQPELDSCGHWRRTMQGHAAANLIPIVAANRVGTERGAEAAVTFYGSSFITDPTGALLAEADRKNETVLYADLDMDSFQKQRLEWGVYRDRRPDLYHGITSHDGMPPCDR